MNEICIHCHWLYFSSIIMSFRQGANRWQYPLITYLSFNLSSLKAMAFLFKNLNLSASCFIFDWYCFSCLISFFLSFRFLILSSSSFWILNIGRSLEYTRFDLKTNKLEFYKPSTGPPPLMRFSYSAVFYLMRFFWAPKPR